MTTYRELVYLVLDELKGDSDDFIFNENHILFLLSKYRTFLLKQRYSDIKKEIPEINYQKIQIPIIQNQNVVLNNNLSYSDSTTPIPTIMTIGNTKVIPPEEYYTFSETSFITKDRLRYVGYNKYCKSIIYSCILDNKYLRCAYHPSNEHIINDYSYMNVVAIFQDCFEVDTKYIATDEGDIMDCIFPMEVNLTPDLVGLVVKELTQVEYKPDDNINNGSDDLSKVNMK